MNILKKLFSRTKQKKEIERLNELLIDSFKKLETKEIEIIKLKDKKLQLEQLVSKKANTITSQGNKMNLLHNEIETQKQQIEDLNKKIRTITASKGGLTKEKNKLQQELIDARVKLSKRFILKEEKPEKVKNTQTMKIKSSSATSKIIKKHMGE